MMGSKAEYVISAMSPAQFPRKASRKCSGRPFQCGQVILDQCGNPAAESGLDQQAAGENPALNFYRINDAFYFVDLPGYGFARVSQFMKKQWAALIEGYLKTRKPFACDPGGGFAASSYRR